MERTLDAVHLNHPFAGSQMLPRGIRSEYMRPIVGIGKQRGEHAQPAFD